MTEWQDIYTLQAQRGNPLAKELLARKNAKAAEAVPVIATENPPAFHEPPEDKTVLATKEITQPAQSQRPSEANGKMFIRDEFDPDNSDDLPF